MQSFTYFDTEIQAFFLLIIGLIVGSFVSLVSYRLVTKEPIIWGRSKCPSCHNKLPIRSLLPLLSWLIQRGKCIFCQAKISYRYPLIELFSALGFVVTFIILDKKIDIKLLIYLAIYTTMFIMIIVDLEHYFIPNILQYLLGFLAAMLVINNGGMSSIIHGVKPALAYAGIGLIIWIFFYYSAGIDGLGIDDLKFFLIAGFMLGLQNIFLFLLLSGFLGAVFGALWQKIKNDETFPFAPAICISAYICLLIGKPILYS